MKHSHITRRLFVNNPFSVVRGDRVYVLNASEVSFEVRMAPDLYYLELPTGTFALGHKEFGEHLRCKNLMWATQPLGSPVSSYPRPRGLNVRTTTAPATDSSPPSPATKTINAIPAIEESAQAAAPTTRATAQNAKPQSVTRVCPPRTSPSFTATAAVRGNPPP
jgi:hypothetical protein